VGVSGDPTAGLVPAAPVVPDVGTCRFGDGLAIGPDLEGAADVALAQALAPLDGIAPDLLCVFVATGVPARIEAVEAAARQVMSTCGARTTIGATAAGVCADGRGVDHGPAVAVWAATLPGARL
jgi:small ligand-binding sensory domain FIST